MNLTETVIPYMKICGLIIEHFVSGKCKSIGGIFRNSIIGTLFIGQNLNAKLLNLRDENYIIPIEKF